MATLLERNITEDYLTCSVCLSIFQDPRQLPCGHSYCLKCLLDYVKIKTVLACPNCRAEKECTESLSLRDWILNLPKDYLLVAVIAAVEKHSADVGDDQIQSIHGCLDSTICNDHARDYEYFCVDHSETICRDCIANCHDKCQYFPLSDLQTKLISTHSDVDTKLVSQLTDLAQLEQKGMLSLVSYRNEKRTAQLHLQALRENVEHFVSVILTDIKTKEENLKWPELSMTSILKDIQIKRSHIEQVRSEITKEDLKQPVTKMKALSELQKQTDTLLTSDEMGTFRFQQFKISLKENKDLISTMSTTKEAATLEIKPEQEWDIIDDSDTMATLDNPDRMLQIQVYRKQEHWVNPDIQNHSSLSGVCIVENHIIIVDQYNNCVLKMGIDGSFIEKFTLPEPHQVCRIANNRIAVTCWDKTLLFLLEVLPNISIFQSTSTKKHYLGIHGMENDRLLVTSPDSSVDIISLSGEIIFSIDIKKSRKTVLSLFRNTLSVPVKAQVVGEDVVICDSMQKLLICTDLAGRVKWQKKIPEISSFACGQNEIYCTLSRSDKIIAVSFDGNITDPSYLKIKHPWSIDVQESTIVVTEDSPSGRFHVVQLE